MRNVKLAKIFASLTLMTFIVPSTSCQKIVVEPVAIAAEDMCSFCRMAISEKQYASELIIRDGDTLKFDDLGCMVDYLAGNKQKTEIVALFVTDFESRTWIKAEDAYYVKSARFKAPMGGDVIAFKDDAKARESAANVEGSLASFEEVMKIRD